MDWAQFVGSTSSRFLREAATIGVSRHLSANAAMALNWGDRVYILKHDLLTQVIGAWVVTKITMPHDLSQKVQELLKQDGKIKETIDQPPIKIIRECGSYSEMGGAIVSDDCTIKEIIEALKKVCKETGEKPFVLVGGKLVETFTPPVLIEPRLKFTRALMHVSPAMETRIKLRRAGGVEIGGDEPKIVMGVEQYYKRTTIDRPDLDFKMDMN